MNPFLAKIQKYITYLVVFLLPLMVISSFTNAFFVGKLTLLAFGVSILLFIWALVLIVTGMVRWAMGRFDIAVLTLAVSYLLSGLLMTPNKMEAFLLPGGATIIIAGSLLYFIVNQLDEKSKKAITNIVFLSGVITSLLTLLALGGLLSKIPQLPLFIKIDSFNSLGGYLPLAIFLGTLLPIGIGFILKEKEIAKRIFYSVCVAILLLTLVLTGKELIPGGKQAVTLPGFDTSWNTTVDTLQNFPVLGIGASNYLTAFNRFRPLAYNESQLWAVRFTSARNLYLTIMTEAGLIGALSLVLLLIALWRVVKSQNWTRPSMENMEVAALILITILLALFPATPYLIVLVFLLLALNADAKVKELDLSGAGHVPAIILAVPIIAGVFAFFYFGGRALTAEAKYKTALDKLSANDGKATYDTLREAININPYVDRYHATYSQVNLALARNIANPADGKTLTDEDRQVIATLIQQSIREAKAVASLNRTRAGNWEVLARTYQTIIAFAQGADQFAVDSYTQAIALDPFNPNLRIALGGLYYALGNYDQAITTFRLAVATKPDLANAHYNLAIAYREKGDIDSAINEMMTVLSLVAKDSKDFELASQVASDLEKAKKSAAEDTENLTTPLSQEQIVKPPLELPSDSQPPSQ